MFFQPVFLALLPTIHKLKLNKLQYDAVQPQVPLMGTRGSGHRVDFKDGEDQFKGGHDVPFTNFLNAQYFMPRPRSEPRFQNDARGWKCRNGDLLKNF
ncbi:hypothetical protein DFH07DRAFT_974386 [Mycena maculata]|uniref:Uncharacterized protein n=1 Tax=Mycena maculata TaxID=230809 RepID=A0AAD7H8X9_9AGAR|nr:hypothetical protein DFH07DRAFT_974386 [Mycena maculata]